MTTSNPDHTALPEPLTVEELFRHVQPIRSADDLACEGIFETDAELDEFLAHVVTARHSDLA
ncbi:MAG TPA: hypothetical protein VLJ59_08175 [Mycobacteriales bacterium]|nr:hypothetical protein [Mycobacteriales bacterium]